MVSKNASIIIPVFNSADNLKKLNKKLVNISNNLFQEYEIIYVDDGSYDNSVEILKEIIKINQKVKLITLSKNYGQHNALLCGLRSANYEIVITLDDDLQNPPEEIPKLIEKLSDGFDVVYGYPKRERHGLFRNLASIVTKLALKTAMGIDNAKYVSSFRAFKTNLRDSFEQYKGSFVSVDVLLSWGTSSFTAVPVNHDLRKIGKSNYTFNKLVQHALNMLTGFSILPLQIASVMGFLSSFFGLGVLIYVLMRFILQGSPVPGFPFLASIITIFSGAQLLAIGIIGEYLARQHFRLLDKPQYFVKEDDSK